jgi:hypothetical protein
MAATFTATTVANPIGAQGTYPQREGVGHEGMIADLQAYVCRSFRNQSGSAIPYGAIVQTDLDPVTNDPTAIQIATSSNAIQGIAVSSQVHEATTNMLYLPMPSPFYSDGRVGYAWKETVNVVSKGVIWVWTTAAVNLTDAVRFHKADNSATVPTGNIGRFTKTALSGKTVLINGARWQSSTTGAGLALLEIDIPSSTFTADA